MTTFVILLENTNCLERGAKFAAVFRRYLHEGQAVFLAALAEHGGGGLDRDRIGLDKQILE